MPRNPPHDALRSAIASGAPVYTNISERDCEEFAAFCRNATLAQLVKHRSEGARRGPQALCRDRPRRI